MNLKLKLISKMFVLFVRTFILFWASGLDCENMGLRDCWILVSKDN
jgi:hypothetical protein